MNQDRVGTAAAGSDPCRTPTAVPTAAKEAEHVSEKKQADLVHEQTYPLSPADSS